MQPAMTPQLDYIVDMPFGPPQVVRMVDITVPGIPGCRTRVDCYEGRFSEREGALQADGSLLLHNRDFGVEVTTHLIPEPGALRWEVEAVSDDPAALQRARSGINPCWWMRPGAGLTHETNVLDVVPRMFIFTERGCVRLSDTERLTTRTYPLDHVANNPPWVQCYVPTWVEYPDDPHTFFGYSPDRPVRALLGCVSRDGDWLVAFGSVACGIMAQGWHDCLHLCPAFTDFADEGSGRIRLRARMYFMENDPAKLLATYLQDFPQETAH
jgi:hypothetical protein